MMDSTTGRVSYLREEGDDDNAVSDPLTSKSTSISGVLKQEITGYEGEDSQTSSNMPESGEVGMFAYGCSKSVKSKNITLDLLIRDGVLDPALKCLSVKYLGVVRTADLLQNGKIRSNDTGEQFSTPSAWAITCKKSINPAKTSGCGWGSIRYKGKSLDLYKSKWMKENMASEASSLSPLTLTPATGSRVSTPKFEPSPLFNLSISPSSTSVSNVDLKPANPTDLLYPSMSALPLADYEKHMATQIRCDGSEFSLKALFSPNVCITMADMSANSKEEISGYLSGTYNHLHNILHVKNVYDKTDSSAKSKISRSREVLVGWFHSHPTRTYYPSVYDVECHMNYQLRVREQPIVSCIIGRKHMEDDSSISMMCFTVSPPKLKFSERFGCLSDKCGKPKSVQWSLENPADINIPPPQPGQEMLSTFMRNLSSEVTS